MILKSRNLKSRNLKILFAIIVISQTLIAPPSHATQNISGQVILNGENTGNFVVYLYKEPHNSELVAPKEHLKVIELSPTGSFSFEEASAQFVILLFPKNGFSNLPLLGYEFQSQRLISKFAYTSYSIANAYIKFDYQNNFLVITPILSLVNRNYDPNVTNGKLVIDEIGEDIAVPESLEASATWRQSTAAFASKLEIFRSFTKKSFANTYSVFDPIGFANSLAWVVFPPALSAITTVKVVKDQNTEAFLAALSSYNSALLAGNERFLNNVSVLISIATSLYAEQLNLTNSRKKQEIRMLTQLSEILYLDLKQVPLKLVASSGLEILVASRTPLVCRVNQNVLMLVKAGDCDVYAIQEGNTNFEPTQPFELHYVVAARVSKTISCMKGKLIKRVTAVNPICPTGYKKK